MPSFVDLYFFLNYNRINKEQVMNRSNKWQEDVLITAANIRKRVMKHTIENNGGYLSQACSSAEVLATLYKKIMNLGESTAPMIPPPFCGVPSSSNKDYLRGGTYNGPDSPEFDRFYLSPAHYALVLYVTLIEVGRMSPEGLYQFNKNGSTVEMIGAEHSPGFDMMGGNLAQTISISGGIALSKKLKKEGGRIWVFMSDGEFQEGQTWEAMQALAHYKLDNIAIFVDVNAQQCDGETKNVMNIEPLDRRLEGFGARVITVNSHKPAEIEAASWYKADGKPLVVLCVSNPCHQIDILEKRRPKLHYVRFLNEEEREEYKQYYKNKMQSKTERAM